MMETDSNEPKILAEHSKDLPEEKKIVPKVSSEGETCEGNENSDVSKIPQKITHFFPVLKPNSRTKIKLTDSVVEKASKDLAKSSDIQGQTSSTLYCTSSENCVPHEIFRSHSEHSKSKGLLPQMPNKCFSDILNTALKTSLSDILRKNIEANNQSESSKELPSRAVYSSNDKHISLTTKDVESTAHSHVNQVCSVQQMEVSCIPKSEKTVEHSVEEKEHSLTHGPTVSKQEMLQQTASQTQSSDQVSTHNNEDVLSNKTLSIQTRLKTAIRHSTKMFSSTSGPSKHSAHTLISPPAVEVQQTLTTPESESSAEKVKETLAYELADGAFLREREICGSKVDEPLTTNKEERELQISTEPLAQILQSDKVAKSNKKSKKRHFKGATYRLYLTPARKKKKLKKRPVDSNCKDDEMSLTSTENGSYIDSSDACSMFSDDFNTSSEKDVSLADDEACSNLQRECSPVLLLADQRIDLSSFKVEPAIESANKKNSNKNIVSPNCEVKTSETADSDIVLPSGGDELTSESEKTKSELCVFPSTSDDSIKNLCDPHQCKSEVTLKTQQNKEVSMPSSHDSEVVNAECDVDACVIGATTSSIKKPTNTRKSVSNYQTICETPLISNIKPDIETKDGALSECKEREKSLKENGHLPPLYTYSGSNDGEGNSFISSDSSKTIPLSTIATSVKSRQRMKRRFTDDIVDTDVGILSLNSMPSSCRKAKVDLPPPPQTQDIIENFQISLNTEARGGPLTKTESIFSSKQHPVDTCTCHGNSYEVKVGEMPTNFYCQAVDSYEEKLVGCSSPVMTFRLIRPSVRIPFTVMCEMHLWRLKQHHCCPRCGVFCSQGAFVQCTAEKGGDLPIVHLFHQRCRGGSEEGKFDFCLHCGRDSEMKNVYLDCEMLSPPAFFQSQLSLILPSKARITFGMPDRERSSKEKEKADIVEEKSEKMYKISESGLTLSSDGLSKDEEIFSLETMIATLNAQNSVEIPDYPVREMYTAASEGNVLKILYMLAKGVNPNEKFLEFDGNTALHAAAASGNVLIVHLLLQAGAISDTMNRNLRTPLMIATEKNHEDIVECLIKRKTPLNTKGEVGMTCLHLAARDGYFKLCKMFLDSGRARVNAQDDGGWTPIVWASEHGHKDIVIYLIDQGGNPNIRDNEGNTALHWAAFCGTAEVCTILLNHGCNIDEANEHGDTPMHIAARQDNFKCIDLFLSRSANLEIRNKANELPLDCCINNPTCKSHKAMRLNMVLREIFNQFHHRSEKILSKDIALGRERYPIRCINGVDDINLDLKEFLYVTENCETCPIKIDRCITSLQHCSCRDDCTVVGCTCSAISFKCWYDRDGHLLPEFNMLDPPLLFECNRACSCDAGICRNRVVQRGMMCRLELVRTQGRGWGVRTLKDIPKGTFICEYVGELITDSEADTRHDDSYLFDLDNKDGETYCLDARHFGNISRFINHLCEPNLVPVKVFIDHQDLSFPRIAFFSLRDIHQYEELGFDYGEKFWVIKSKSFTCNCGSAKCKYSAETIKETLENYNMRIRDELHEEINIYSV